MNTTSTGLTRRQLMISTTAIAGTYAFIGAAAKGGVPRQTSLNPEVAAFLNPPDEARPWVYWCWLDSNVTEASITLDLTAMRDVGIGGVLLLDVFQGTPKGPMRFMDATWQACFLHAVKECARLNLELIFNNGVGYYGSGGPWVPPENGLQTLVSSETPIVGGQTVQISLPRPRVATDDPLPPGWWEKSEERLTYAPGKDYRDIVVLAIKEPPTAWQHMTNGLAVTVTPSLPSASAPFQLIAEANPVFTVNFADTRCVGVADISFNEVSGDWQIIVDVLTLGIADLPDTWVECGQVSTNDANAWKPATILFEPIEAKTFRIRFVGNANARGVLRNLELHARYRIPDHDGMKGLHWWEWNDYTGVASAPLDASLPSVATIVAGDIIDLSAQMESDGRLQWEAPAGNWTIMRIGHAFKGRTVGPGRIDTIGPETDKLDRDATRLHFNAMVKPLVDLVGEHHRKALVATHIDSWEGGGQNWTARMRTTFKARRGYDPAPYLPALVSGRVVDGQQKTERFLWDVRQTVSELATENYWGEMQRLSNAAGLSLSGQTYTTTGQDLDAAARTDLPIAEFWNKSYDGFYHTARTMSSSAHLNGQTIVAAEAFTANETERWLDHPARLKAQGDHMFAQGINRFVFHRYAAQRFAHVSPGLQMGPWGLHYERTNTWWNFTAPWHLYLTRTQHMLRRGKPTRDLLYLQSEEPLLRVKSHTVKGYDYDICGPDMFKTARVENNLITFPSGASYSLLVLAHSGTMTLDTLQRLTSLVSEGANILGEPPLATPGLTDYPQADGDLARLAAQLWTNPDGRYGLGGVFSGMTEQAALQSLGISPDFESDQALNWSHRRDGKGDIYFVANPSDQVVLVTAVFRVKTSACTYWDAEYGAVTRCNSAETTADGRVRLTFPLSASGALFVVFDDDIIAPDIPQELPLADKAEAIIEGGWTVNFSTPAGASQEIIMNPLISWADHPDDSVRHFSGTATYKKHIDIDGLQFPPGKRLFLDLGAVEIMARVRLNGHDLGVLWRPPYQVDITRVSKAGQNVLEIVVVNLWVNRLIGDDALPEDSERYDDGTRKVGVNNGTLKAWPKWLLDSKRSPAGRQTFVSWRLWRKDEPLTPSGLLGPVRLLTDAG